MGSPQPATVVEGSPLPIFPISHRNVLKHIYSPVSVAQYKAMARVLSINANYLVAEMYNRTLAPVAVYIHPEILQDVDYYLQQRYPGEKAVVSQRVSLAQHLIYFTKQHLKSLQNTSWRVPGAQVVSPELLTPHKSTISPPLLSPFPLHEAEADMTKGLVPAIDPVTISIFENKFVYRMWDSENNKRGTCVFDSLAAILGADKRKFGKLLTSLSAHDAEAMAGKGVTPVQIVNALTSNSSKGKSAPGRGYVVAKKLLEHFPDTGIIQITVSKGKPDVLTCVYHRLPVKKIGFIVDTIEHCMALSLAPVGHVLTDTLLNELVYDCSQIAKWMTEANIYLSAQCSKLLSTCGQSAINP